MFRPVCLSLLLAMPVLGATASEAGAGVTLTYVVPETFRDREFRRASSRISALAEFDALFADLGRRHLPPGQDLEIEILDIDLAGDFEPWNFPGHDVRILRAVTPPRMHLRYRLIQDGVTVREADERLVNLTYLSDPRARHDARRFAHDRLMVSDWFRRTFATAGPDPEPRSRLPGS